MDEQLKEEAMGLSRMRHRELAKRDEYGHQTTYWVLIGRLDDLLQKAADRWRRRAGYANEC